MSVDYNAESANQLIRNKSKLKIFFCSRTTERFPKYINREYSRRTREKSRKIKNDIVYKSF